MRSLLCVLLICLWGSSAAGADKPNIMFLLADDFTWEAVGYLQQTDIETPNLDRLARRGVTFTHAYNMGSWSGAVCIASRNMLLTGAACGARKKVAKQTEALRQAGQLWPGLMKAAGYDTYMTGKWHIEAKAEKSFDVVRHVRPGMPPTVPSSYNRPVEGQPDKWSASDESLGGFWQGGQHWTEVAADDAIDYIGLAQGKPNPFFMYIAFNAPHDPRQAPLAFQEMYPLDRISVPSNYLDQYPYKDAIGCGRIYAMRSWAHFRALLMLCEHTDGNTTLPSHTSTSRSDAFSMPWNAAVRPTILGSSLPPIMAWRWDIMDCSASKTCTNTVCGYHLSSPAPSFSRIGIHRLSTCRTRWLLRSSWPYRQTRVVRVQQRTRIGQVSKQVGRA